MTQARIVSRRLLLQWSGLATVACCAKELLRPGVQLYTVRAEVLKNPGATLQAIANIGYREAEMLRNQLKVLAPLLKRTNLTPVSLHFETPLLTGNWEARKHADLQPVEDGVTNDGCVSMARDHGIR